MVPLSPAGASARWLEFFFYPLHSINTRTRVRVFRLWLTPRPVSACRFPLLFTNCRWGLRAVSAVVLHADGERQAVSLACSIDPGLLTPDEYALIAPLRYART